MRNGWDILAKEINEKRGNKIQQDLINREKGLQKQFEDKKIRNSIYNKRYKMTEEEEVEPKYLKRGSKDKRYLSTGIKALVRTRCGNMEEDSKYWLEEDKRSCTFCNLGKDNWDHFVKK